MMSLRIGQSSETVSKMKCKNLLLDGVSGWKLAKLLMSRSLHIVFSQTYRLNLERRVDRMQRKLRVKSKILFNKMISLEEPSMKKSDKRQQRKRRFLLMSKRLLSLNKRLRCILSNSTLRRGGKRLSMLKDWPSKSKREKCMLKNLKSRTPKKKLTTHREFSLQKWQMSFKRKEWSWKMNPTSTLLL